MAFVFKFPDLGEGIHEGKIVRWLVKEGDVVKADQIVAEVETDKAVVELPSPSSGTMLKQYFKEGESVQVGKILLVIGQPGEPVPEQEASPTPPGHAKVVPISPSQEHKLSPSDTSLHVTIQGERPATAVSQVSQPSPSGAILATPATRALARELGVDLSAVAGSGPGGRITPEDVKGFQSGAKSSAAPQAAAAPAPAQALQLASGWAYPKLTFPTQLTERVPLTGLRKAIGEKMVESKRWVPHVTHFDEADITQLEGVRQSSKKQAEEEGVKLTMLPYVVKATVNALKQFPEFNASLDVEKNEIVLKKFYHVGVAVDTPEGLIVVVVRDADKKGLLELAKEISSLAEKARGRKVSLDEIRGGTFTITNIGSIGGVAATPIINFPETAILGVFRGKDKPVVVEGQVAIRKIMPLCVSFDHRVIDGAAGARFLSAIIKQLEDPSLL